MAPAVRDEGQLARVKYFVVMIDYGRRHREAIVDPESQARGQSRQGEYRNISFIHEIEDITAEILGEAALPDVGATGADLQAGHFDHVRELRKHTSG